MFSKGDSMVSILHISDLHLMPNPDGYNLEDSIITYARDKFHDIPYGKKLLIITGDLRNYQQKGYELSKDFLDKLIEVMDIQPNKDVFVVPGNHDVSPSPSCDDLIMLLNKDADSRKKLNQSGAFRDEKLPKLLSRYESYLQFVRDEMKIYDAASEHSLPVRVHVHKWRDSLNILHLNTALIANGFVKTNQLLDALEVTSPDVKRELSDGLPCIAIGHNSFPDLDKKAQEQLKGAFLYRNITAYLCGDRHQTAKNRKERAILLQENPPVVLHNIVAPRGSSDTMDSYSDFGMILHKWNERTGQLTYTIQSWSTDEQGGILDGVSREYAFRNYQPPKSFVTPPDIGSASAPVTVSNPVTAPTPVTKPAPSASAPPTEKLSPQERFLADIQSLSDNYGFHASIGRVCFMSKRLIETLNDPKATISAKSRSMVDCQNLLRKTIADMENDLEDLHPDKSDRIAKLERALADLKSF